jgi:hypothetical protein
MAKSIHQRVRAQLEKKARDEKRAADQAHDRILRAAEKLDLEFERGQRAYEEQGVLPQNASKEMRRGFMAAASAETREMLGE